MPHELSAATQSPYYPRRVGRGRMRRRLRRGWVAAKAGLHLDRIHPPAFGTWGSLVMAALVPGWVFRVKGPRFVATLIWIAVPVLSLVFLAGLGTPLSNLAFMMIVGAHAVSVSRLLRPVLIRCRPLVQAVGGLALFMAISALIYVPVREWVHANIAMPLRVHGRVVIVNPRIQASAIQRGDLVAYHLRPVQVNLVHVTEGIGLRPVWGMPGETIAFKEGSMLINGRRHPAPWGAALTGTFVVPQESWLIWPELRINNEGVSGDQIETAMRRLATVSHDQLIGRAYARWFFRKQGQS